MADATRTARRTRQRAQDQVEDRTPDLDAEEGSDEPQDGQEREGDGGQQTVTAELKDAIRQAAVEVLRPVARSATTSAAKFAVTKGPDLVRDRVLPRIEDAGGAGALAKGALSRGGSVGGGITERVGGMAGKVGEKVGIGGGDGGQKKPTGHGRGRRLPVQESVDVAADIQTVYDEFTQFEDWPNFMHRVEKVEQRDDTTVMFHENIWGVRRSWEAEIVEQMPCERIVWRSKGQPQVVGVATFHKLADNLTRVQVNMDFQPKGLFEKAASGFRMSRRALRSDLMRFKAFVEMRDEATGSWRGRIEEGEVVESPEDRQDGEGAEGRGDEEEAQGRADEDEAQGGADEEQYADEDEEEAEPEEEEPPRAEEEEEPEEEEPPPPARRRRPRPRAEQDEEPEQEPAPEDEEEPVRPRRSQARRRARTGAGTASSPRPAAGSGPRRP